MGPITLFDKSFLQSLSVDESVWFDHFFLANVCPTFYIETLADLEKSPDEGRTPEQEVALIADKFPEMHGAPNAYYVNLCIGNLLGHPVPMTGKIQLAGGQLVKVGGKTGAVFEESSEAEAFLRWQKHQFMEIERRYAKAWREALSKLDLGEVAKAFRVLGVDGKSCKTLEDAKGLADRAVSAGDKSFEPMKLALLFLNVPRHLHRGILGRWEIFNYPPLVQYAPYVAYVLTVEIFFQLSVAAKLISGQRPSNRVDMAYLFYLPFCMMFVSSDRLHRRCAPLFLRSDQEFVWGQELKEGLCELNAHYSQLPDSTRERGVMSFGGDPPKEGDFFVAQLWDRHFPNWREMNELNFTDESADDSKLVEEIKKIAHAPPLSPDEVDFDPADTDSISIRRRVRKRKGSWAQLPSDLEVPPQQ